MAQLKDLIVSGAARILGKLYASEFVGKLTGNADTATKATQDSGGQQINTTYIKGLSVSGKTITYTKGNGTTGTITTQDTVYTHPTYTARSAGFYKVTVDGSGHVSNATAVAKSDITALGIPGTNTTYSTFTKATSDAAGGSGLVPAPAKGQQGLYLRGDGTWATPTNTTYSAATTSTSGLMTADMVTKLNGIATGANAYSHPTYTAKSSGLYKVTVDGTGHVSATAAVTKADITALGIPGSDTNTDTKMTQTAVTSTDYTNWRTVLWGASNSGTEGFSPTTVTDGAFSDKNLTYQPSTGTLRATTFKGNLAWSNITGKPSTYTPASHTHNYAGSSSAGGSATSAVKLDTATAGSATQPVYFSSGKPTACTYTLGKSVPSNAVFTDTTYPIYYKTITDDFYSKFRTQTKGDANSGDYLSIIRCDTNIPHTSQYGTGLSWGRVDTHGYLYLNYQTAQVFVGAGQSDKLNWISELSFVGHKHTYDEISGKPDVIKATKANNYWGIVDPNGTDSDYIRTTSAGLIPYQLGGIGSGHSSLGTSVWSFKDAYIDTINCSKISAISEIITTSANGYRIVYGNYGFFIRNDGTNAYFLSTKSEDQYGSWSDAYFGMNLETGQLMLKDDKGNRLYPVLSSISDTYRVVREQVSGNNFRFDDGSGTARYCTGSSSDIRLKKNVKDTTIKDALSIINSMKIRSFDWKDTNEHQNIGFIADELEKIDPKLAYGGGETESGGINVKVVDTFYMLGYVVKSLQELSSQVELLKKENSELKEKIDM